MRGMRTLAALGIATSLALTGSACSSKSDNSSADTKTAPTAASTARPKTTATQDAEQGQQIVVAMCNGTGYTAQRRLVRVNLSDGSTSAAEDRYFSVEPETYDSSIAQCNSGYSGAQQAGAYADNFSKLAVTFNKDNVSKHIGFETASNTPLSSGSGAMPQNVQFTDLSGATNLSGPIDNEAGGIGHDGRIYYGDYDEATGYSLKSVSLSGGDNKVYKKLSSDGARSSYFQPGADTPTIIPSGGLIQDAAYLPGKDYGFTAFDTTVRSGTKSQLESGKGKECPTANSTSSKPAPKPFKPLDKFTYLGYTEHTIDFVQFAGNCRMVGKHLMTIGATIEDPFLTKDGKFIVFVANDSVFRMPRDGSSKPKEIWTVPDQNTVDLTILATTIPTK